MKPGATINPVASNISTFCGAAIFPAGSTSRTVSPSRSPSMAASVLDAGSRTRPFLTRSMRRVLFICRAATFLGRRFRHRMSAILTRTGDEQEKQRHSNRNAVGHLLEHAGLRSVRNFRGDLDPSIHWSRMQNDRARLRVAQSRSIKLVSKHVIFRRDRRFMLPFGLHAKNKNYVRTFERLLDSKDAPNGYARRADLFQLARNPHRWPAECELAPEFAKKMNVRTRYAAMLQIAENRDVQTLDRAQPVANRQRIEQPLRRMFVRAVACIDHWDVQMLCYEIRSARGRMPHHQAIRLHRVKRVNGIEQRLAFLQAGRFRLQIHGVRAQSRSCGAKADTGARGVFEERQRHGLTPQRR